MGLKIREIFHHLQRCRVFNNGENTFAWNGISKNLSSETQGIVSEMRELGGQARVVS